MRRARITYGQLDGVLQSLGFSVHVEKGRHRLFAHGETGAIMSLPNRRPSASAHATYVAAVRMVLANYDIADEIEFASQLLRAS